MFGPTGICNLLTALPTPPWTKPLNWGLHMTPYLEEQIPFHLYVQRPAQISVSLHISSFPQFDKLPAEIQLRILSFCSAPTLFQIMHVSSVLRIEAAKLFWANPNTYYLIESNWLLEGGYPGNTFYDLNFFAHVQNVEVDYLGQSDDKISSSLNFATTGIQHTLIDDFWKTLQKRFPRVRKVVINKNWLYSLVEPIETIPQSLQILLESCPPEIDVSAFVVERRSSPTKIRTETEPKQEFQRPLYRHASDAEHLLCWNRKTILMPMKSSHGPIGEFMRLHYKSKMVSLQKRALMPLAIEALDRHHFDEGRLVPFSCPSPRCDIYFNKPGQWSIHAAKIHNAAEFAYWNYRNILPEVLRDVVKRHRNDTKEKSSRLFNEFKQIQNAWNEEGGEERRKMEHGWANQLENDEVWDTGQKAMESELYKNFIMLMGQGLDGFREMEANIYR